MNSNDFFKYVTVSEEDKEWELFIKVAGSATIEKNTQYPPAGHPATYSFNSINSRILNEYQLNYISEGYGLFECNYGSFPICPGTIIVLFPEEWHRYQPLEKTGWTEHYIGFDGNMCSKILKPDFFKKESPILQIGFHTEIQDIFTRISQQMKDEKSGYQQICTGLIIAYIGLIISCLKNKEFEGTDLEKKIQQACYLLRENIAGTIDIEKLAEKLGIGYSYFRKMFKKYTGISPLQYHLQLKLQQAEALLLFSNKTVKEIAFDLGFQSVFYFSRLFKEKTGKNPSIVAKNTKNRK